MPRILWMSPYSLHDISSGASIHCKTVLEGLVKRGFEVWSCSSFVFDVPQAANSLSAYQAMLDNTEQNVFELDENGIHYIYTRCHSTHEIQQTLAEQDFFYNIYLEVLDNFKPDFVIGFGTSMLSMTTLAEAKRRGIYTIYPVLNGNHSHFAFPDVDLILTDSQASANLYKVRDRIRMIPTCEIFNEELCLAKKRAPKYVTFVNPSFEKGLAIFAKIAKLSAERFPDVRFLVINSRGNFANNIKLLHTKGNKEEHPFTPQDFPNVDMTPGTNDMRPVYGLTKVLIAPSLWWESWGRVATEAVINGIPVLASNSGGLPEATAHAGIHIAPPQHTLDDYYSIPDDDEIKPWLDALDKLLHEDHSEALKQAKDELSVDKGLDRLLQILLPYCQAQVTNYAHYNFSNPRL